MLENQKIRPAQVIGPLGEPLTLESLPPRGTTRWVVEDPTGDTVGLAAEVGDVPLVATPLSFAQSRYPQLRAYEQGFVKEGVGAGGCAIAAQLYRGWSPEQILQAVDAIAHRHAHLSNPSSETAPA